MAIVETAEAQRATRDFVRHAMKVPLLEQSASRSWPGAGASIRTSGPCMN
jgi:hypothetical protein